MEKGAPFCDWRNPKKQKVKNNNRFYKYRGNFAWQGVKTEKYKTEGSNWANVIKKVLIGRHGETTRFHLRYFEISPGGYSSFEKHRHEHVVIGIRGKGMVLCGRKTYELHFLDTLYIASNTPHQLSNPFNEPFGFLCIVNAKRDGPKILQK